MSECKHEWKMLIYSGAYAGAICTLCGETRSESETEALLNRQNKSADYWSNWVYPEGASPDDVQNELADFHDMIDRFECMLDHATGGRMSKATYTKDAMISVIDDHINELVDEETIALKEENAALSELLSHLVDVELERDKLKLAVQAAIDYFTDGITSKEQYDAYLRFVDAAQPFFGGE